MPRKTAGRIVPNWAKPKAPKAVKELVKKTYSAKTLESWGKNLAKHEMAQELRARLSDNPTVFMQGFITAAIPLILVIGYLLSV